MPAGDLHGERHTFRRLVAAGLVERHVDQLGVDILSVTGITPRTHRAFPGIATIVGHGGQRRQYDQSDGNRRSPGPAGPRPPLNAGAEF